MGVKILSLGVALPGHGAEQSTYAMLASGCSMIDSDNPRVLEAIYRRSGVKHRSSVLLHRVDRSSPAMSFYPPARDCADHGPTTARRMQRYSLEATPLALQAASQAIHLAGVNVSSVAHLITASCTGFTAPGIDVELLKRLALSPGASRTHVGFMGCHGAFNALRVASALVEQSRGCALVCAVELCSLHFAYGSRPQGVVANALFADGAAAAVVAPGASQDDWTLDANGSCVLDGCESAMTWTIGDHGFEMTLSAQVPALIATRLRPWLEGWLGENRLCIADVPSWAVHPGGPRVLQAVAETLNLPRGALDDSHAVLAQCGNMSSPTILFILDRLRRHQAPRPCVALGFGPGLAIEAMLFR